MNEIKLFNNPEFGEVQAVSINKFLTQENRGIPND
jgi:hypothetical protein